jgi:DNA-binding MarR family transcriptional regulator
LHHWPARRPAGTLLDLPLLYGEWTGNPVAESQTTFVNVASPDVARTVGLLTVGSWTATYNGWMPARPDPAQLAAWRLLLEAHATVTELLERELVAERGLPLSRYDVLLNLAEAPGGRLRMQELSASVLLSKSGLSRLVDRMVAAGLVRRERCEDDRRGWFAVLTDQGRSALRRAAPVHLRGIQEHFTRHLAPEEVQVLTAALSRVVAAASASTEPIPLADRAPAPDPGEMASAGSAADHR